MQVKELADRVIAAVKGYVSGALGALTPRFDAIERRLDQLESGARSHGMHYVGVWRAGWHLPGSVVTDQGSMWHCWKETRERPGSSPDWQLMYKTREVVAGHRSARDS